MTTPKNQTTATTPTSPIKRFIDRLLTPSSVTDHVNRQQLRFQTTMILAFAILLSINVFFRLAFASSPAIDRLSISTIVTTGLLFLAYGISRSTHHKYAAPLSIGALILFVYLSFFFSPTNANNLLWLSGIFILASSLLSFRQTLIFFVINIVFVAALPLISPHEVTSGSITLVASLLFVVGSSILVTSYHRNQLETIRQQELTAANLDLQILSHSLEDRVQERTQDLALATEVGHIVSQIYDLDQLLTQSAHLIRDRFNLYYTQIYLTNPEADQLVLRAGTGEVGQILLKREHVLPLEERSINATAVVKREPVIVVDTLNSDIFLPNPDLPATRSELSLPLIAKDKVVGALNLQSDRPYGLSEDNLPAFTILASQLAIAIENASLFQTQQNLVRENEDTSNFLNSVIENLPIMLFVKDAATLRYIRANQAARDVMGITEELIINKTDQEMAPPEIGPLLLAQDQEVLKNGVIQRIPEQRILTSTLEERLIQTTKLPIFDSHGQAKYLLTISQDITNYKEIEQELTSRINQLNLLNEIGRKAEESAGLDDFMNWATERVPQSMGYPEQCITAVRLDHVIYGNEEAIHLPRQMVEELRIRNKIIGAIYIAYTDDSLTFRNEDSALIGSISRRISGFVENIRLLSQLQDQAENLQKVAKISTRVVAIRNPYELTQEIVDQTLRQFNLYQTAVFLLQDDELKLASTAGQIDADSYNWEEQFSLINQRSLISRAATTQQSIMVNDVDIEPDFLAHPLLPATRSEIVTPLIVGDQLLGVLDVQSDKKNNFTEEDVNIFATLASQVAVALQNARQHQQTQSTLDELNALQRVITGQNWEMFMTAHERPVHGYLAKQEMVQPLVRSLSKTQLPSEIEPVSISHLVDDEKVLLTPIEIRGATIGKLGIRMPENTPLSEENKAILTGVSRQVAEALERARLLEETEVARSQTELLYTGSEEVVRATTINDVLLALVRSTKLQEFDRANLLFFTEEFTEKTIPESMSVTAVWEKSGQTPLSPIGTTYQLKNYPIFKFITRDTPFVVNDIDTDPRLDDNTRNLFINQLNMHSATVFPLIASDQWIGILTAQSRQNRTLNNEDVRQISSLVDQAATVAQTQRLFEQAQIRTRQLSAINQVAQAVSQQLDINQVLTTVHQQVAQVMLADAFSVSRYNPADNTNSYLYIYDGGELHPLVSGPLHPESLSHQVITTGEAMMKNYTQAEQDNLVHDPNQTIGNDKFPPSVIFAPLSVAGNIIGVISVQSYQFNAYTENDLALFIGIANHMAVALENARLFTQTQNALAETQKRTEELALVNNIVTQLGSSLDIQQAMQFVAEGLVNGIGVDQARIALIDGSRQSLTVVAEYFDPEKSTSAMGSQIPITGNLLTEEVLKTRQAIVVNDAQNNPQTEPIHHLLQEQGIQTMAILPMMIGNEVLGTVGMDLLTEGESISDDMLQLAETVIFQATAAIQNARLFAQTEAALQEVQALFEFSSNLNAATSFQEIVDGVGGPALASGADAVYLNKLQPNPHDDSTTTILISSTKAEVAPMIGQSVVIPASFFRLLWLSTNDPAVFIEDPKTDTRLTDEIRPIIESMQMRSFVLMKLIVGNRLIGQITITWADLHLFTDAERRLYNSIAAQVAAVLDSTLLLEEIQERATELQESTIFLDSVIENLPVMLFVKDAEALQFVRWNKSASDITGQPPEHYLGKTDYDFLPAEEAEFLVSKEREILKGGEIVEISDERIETKYQGERILHTRKVPILDSAGKPKYLLGISEDITERRHYEEALAKRALELQTVAEISTAVASNLEAPQLLQDVVEFTRDRFGLYHAHIYLLDETGENLTLVAGSGEVGAKMVAEGRSISVNSERSLVARAARMRQGVIANDIMVDSGFLSHPLLPNTRAEMAVPLIAGNKVIGVLDVQSEETGHFTTQDINIQSTLASQVATTLQNAQLFSQTEKRAAELAIINVINQVASSQLDVHTLIQSAGDRLQQTFNAQAIYIALFDAHTGTISFPYFIDKEEGVVQMEPRNLTDANGGLTAQIIQSGEALLVSAFDEADAEAMGAQVWGEGPLTDSYIGAPMILGDTILGVIGISSYSHVRTYNEEDRNLLMTLAGTIGVALQNAQQFESTRRRAERERIVNEITQKIQGTLNMQNALQTAVKELGQALGAEHTQIELKLGDESGASTSKKNGTH